MRQRAFGSAWAGSNDAATGDRKGERRDASEAGLRAISRELDRFVLSCPALADMLIVQSGMILRFARILNWRGRWRNSLAG